jgi:hypothetical protein
MLRNEVNDLLTQTDAGTPMGELFRQYWIPAMLGSELPEDDCPPVRVKADIATSAVRSRVVVADEAPVMLI